MVACIGRALLQTLDLVILTIELLYNLDELIIAYGIGANRTWPKLACIAVNAFTAIAYLERSSQKATAEAAATFRELTPWYMGIFTV